MPVAAYPVASNRAVPIDWKRCQRIYEKATKHLRKVFRTKAKEFTKRRMDSLVDPSGVDVTYQAYINTAKNVPPANPGLPVRARRAEDLVRDLCSHITPKFEVVFLEVDLSAYKMPSGYISWLVPFFEPQRRFCIVYDSKKLVGSSPADAEKQLERILLHEAGHARLHLDRFEKANVSGVQAPRMGPVEEREAWMYADCLRGLLVGCASYDMRYYGAADGAWQL
jgi:hypothetical protein